MTNKVIVAIDSTGLSELVPRSLPMKVRPEETEILVLQVVEPLLHMAPPELSPGYQPENTAHRKELKDRAKESLELAVEALCKEGYSVTSRLIEGEITEGIIHAAAMWGADMIVVTSHARKGVAKFFHRSVAESIVHHAPCSVLVMKEEEVSKAAA